MKRLWMMLLVFAMALEICVPVYGMEGAPASEEAYTTASVEYLEDGSYIVTVITEEPAQALAYATASSTNTKTGTKTSTYVNADGEALWSVSVRATFQYVTGSLATCVSATGSAESYSSVWKLGTPAAEYQSNYATATVTGTKYFGGLIPLDKVTLSVKLTCDVNGKLS